MAIAGQSNSRNIVTIDITTGEKTWLTKDTLDEWGLSVSPDGKSLLFASRERSGNYDIYKMDLVTKEIKPLTDHKANDMAPCWSPSGEEIVFTSERDAKSRELYLMDSNGGNVRRLTVNEVYDGSPVFSPTGNKILFVRQTEPPKSGEHVGNGEVMVMDKNGKNEKQLTHKTGWDDLPHFSPNGKDIVFHGAAEVGYQIYKMKANGKQISNISQDSLDNRWPRWSPDGQWISYIVTIDKISSLWIMRPDGTDKKKISDGESVYLMAEWFPLFQK